MLVRNRRGPLGVLKLDLELKGFCYAVVPHKHLESQGKTMRENVLILIKIPSLKPNTPYFLTFLHTQGCSESFRSSNTVSWKEIISICSP